MVPILRSNDQIVMQYSECGCTMNLCDGILINFVFRVPLLTVPSILFLWAWISYFSETIHSHSTVFLVWWWLIWSLSLCLNTEVSLSLPLSICVTSLFKFKLHLPFCSSVTGCKSLQHCYAIHFLFWLSWITLYANKCYVCCQYPFLEHFQNMWNSASSVYAPIRCHW